MSWNQWGAFAFGLLVGWITYRTLQKGNKKAAWSDLLVVVSLVGGEAVLSQVEPRIFGSYGWGLAIGVFLQFVAVLAATGRDVDSWFAKEQRVLKRNRVLKRKRVKEGTASESFDREFRDRWREMDREHDAREQGRDREIDRKYRDRLVEKNFEYGPRDDLVYGSQDSENIFIVEGEESEDRAIAKETTDTAASPENARYVNVCIVLSNGKSIVPKTKSLSVAGLYDLRLDIGALSPDTAVRNPEAFPSKLLPRTETGHWLEVVAVSDEFRMFDLERERLRHHLFLPKEGPSWVCTCSPGGAHTCSPKERSPYLFIGLQPPTLKTNETSRIAHIRIGIYYQKNLVQSQLLTAGVSKTGKEGEGYFSDIDYTLTAELMDLSVLPHERTINILTNQNVDGTHKVVINGREADAAHFNINETQMSNAMGAVRAALRDFHLKDPGSGKPEDFINLYDKHNRKPKEEFIEDLKRMAWLGWVLWNELMADQSDLQTSLATTLKAPASIQVSRVKGTSFVFPWAMVYDIPLEFSNDYKLYSNCRLLDEWDNVDQLLPQDQSRCPYEQTHRLNVICPFGLWGFKHQIEQPPSMPKGRNLPLKITIANQPPEMVMGVSLNLNPDLTQDHLDELEKRLNKFHIEVNRSLDDVKTALDDPKLEIVYFYCHGRRKLLPGSNKPIPILEVGTDGLFAPSDLTAWRLGRGWPDNHWHDTSPLIFINGCNTAELTPELLVNFVDNFMGQYASGVIGTEVTLHQYVAGEAAEEFFHHFQTQSVGRSLHLMRRHLLLKGNLLGLAYTPYCSTSLSF
ncbi:MAG TPA: hypothetical protein VJU86_22970 [Pyrinomonadaceae bacterium]|nr:hypothetical protein [Pyrinomonadaceae bacterium]